MESGLMADEAKKTKETTKKVKPTNCAQSNKRIRRKDWYYRNGKFFANKQAHKLFVKAEADKAVKAKEAQAAAAAAPKTAE